MALDKNMRIILAEDGGTMRKMEVRILNQIGFENIAACQDGVEAMRELESAGEASLVISDWNMPNKNGMELLQEMRADQRFASIPFIMATGQGDKQYVAQAMEAGANGVVAKPFSPDELKSLIEQIFGVAQEKSVPPVPAGLETDTQGKPILKVAHIQITDHLALGVMKSLIHTHQAESRTFTLETVCMPNWNRVQSALETGEVNAAFILAPIAMDLFNYGTPIRLVLFAHRNGSIMVRSKTGQYGKIQQQFFKHRTFYIPHKMSIHHMLAHKYFSEMGLKPGMAGGGAVNLLLDVVAPVNMPEFLADNPSSCGFMVAEPIGSRAIASGIAERQFLSGEMWANHPCCVVVFRQEFLDQHPEAVHEFTRILVQAGQFIHQEPEKASEIAVSFLDPEGKLGLKAPLIRQVLSEPMGIKTDDLYPSIEDLDIIQRYMNENMNIGSLIDLNSFVDLRFAQAACPDRIRDAAAQLDSSETATGTVSEGRKEREDSRTELKIKSLNTSSAREGKYLVFQLADERYGVSVMDVREIIQMRRITFVPNMPGFYKGTINLRGKVIPVTDLRLTLGMAPIDYDDRTCIIILEMAGATGSTLVGVTMDAAVEVLDIQEDKIQDTPYFGERVNTSFITGLARTNNKTTTLLDIDKLYGADSVIFNAPAANAQALC
ncbi:Chemotaxis signal transduction protein [Syntrophus gentianae]|uniref:Chemotaxis signal transduction protein n=1 Tax=Syntrophus gentianae TaxID=43775 RepID=A0A1H7UXT4_9BACT|nr:chemotaxis protein CheW [Syntrophus gentianae]SEM01448.1 Chemotaxis signal transduction protein [Syntrophus gentianae]